MSALLIAMSLNGCSWQGSIGQPMTPAIVPPPGARVIEEPNGAIIEEPVAAPIETVLTGLRQAQEVRALTRQLAR